MAFLVKAAQAVVSVISQLFQSEPSGIQFSSVQFHHFKIPPTYNALNAKNIITNKFNFANIQQQYY